MRTSANNTEPGRLSDSHDPPGGEASAEELDDQERLEAIERVSPEGRPAHPEMGDAQISWLVLFGVIFVLVLSVVFAAIAGIAAGAVVLALGLGIAVLMNPEMWASLLRARERKRSGTVPHHRDRRPRERGRPGERR